MHDIEMAEISEAFSNCWKAAASHLHRQGQGSLNWLRAHLTPPFLEHLSFRIGNQLFFVRVEDVAGQVVGPASLKGLLFVADECKGHACLMPMSRRGSEWRCTVSDWGLIDARSQKIINPVSLVTDEEIELTDWELQDVAVEVVRSKLEQSGKLIMSWQGNPAVDPSLWFVGEDGPEWVVVRAARYPKRDVPVPANIDKIVSGLPKYQNKGNFAVVRLVNASDPFDPTAQKSGNFLPIIRGHGISVGYDGLKSLASLELKKHQSLQDLSRDLIAELLGWFEKLLESETVLSKVFMGVNGDGQQFVVFMSDLDLDHREHPDFMRYVLHSEKSIAFAYKMRTVVEINRDPQALREDHIFYSGQIGKYFAIDVTSRSPDSWADGVNILRKSETETPEIFLQDLLCQSYKPSQFDAEYAALWNEIRPKIRWRQRDLTQ